MTAPIESSLPLLLEVGCEEIPARFLHDAEKGLGERVQAALRKARLLPWEQPKGRFANRPYERIPLRVVSWFMSPRSWTGSRTRLRRSSDRPSRWLSARKGNTPGQQRASPRRTPPAWRI